MTFGHEITDWNWILWSSVSIVWKKQQHSRLNPTSSRNPQSVWSLVCCWILFFCKTLWLSFRAIDQNSRSCVQDAILQLFQASCLAQLSRSLVSYRLIDRHNLMIDGSKRILSQQEKWFHKRFLPSGVLSSVGYNRWVHQPELCQQVQNVPEVNYSSGDLFLIMSAGCGVKFPKIASASQLWSSRELPKIGVLAFKFWNCWIVPHGLPVQYSRL